MDRDTTITWYGHACVEVRTPGGQDDPDRPVVRQPAEPAHGRLGRALRPPARHPRPRRPHGRCRGARQPAAAGLAVHPRDEPVAGPPPAGRRRRGDRDEQGRHGRGGRDQGHDDPRRPLGRRLEPEAARRRSTWASRPGSSSSSRTASASTTPATPTSSATWRLIRELYQPDLAMLPIGGHFTMGPREAALAVELLGVQHVMPIHYGTFPVLAGTPGPAADRARRPRPGRRRDPRARAGRQRQLISRRQESGGRRSRRSRRPRGGPGRAASCGRRR